MTTTKTKKTKPTSSTDTKGDNSVTKVNHSKSAAFKYMTGERDTVGFKSDLGLYAGFKPLAKRVYGSVCHAFEIYMIAVIEAVEKGVNFSNTSKPINIERIVIERNLRPRRKLEFRGDYELARCYVEGCGCAVAGSATYLPTKVLYHCCQPHLDKYAKDPNWRLEP